LSLPAAIRRMTASAAGFIPVHQIVIRARLAAGRFIEE
jgi:hypothetical protein